MDKKQNIQETMPLLGGGKTYKEKIIKMVNQIENQEYLEFIYNMMIAFKEKWGI